jgi:hypothetical protein
MGLGQELEKGQRQELGQRLRLRLGEAGEA